MLTANHVNLQRVALARLAVVTVVALGLIYAFGWHRASLPYAALFTVLGALAAASVASFWRLGRPWPVTHAEFFGQLLLDVAAATLVLFWTGGAANPFASYYLVPLAMAAALLPGRLTAVLAIAAVGLHTLLLFIHEPLPVLLPRAHGHDRAVDAHVLGMWFNFAVSAALITYVVVRMAATVREQREELNRRRERDLHDEQLLGVATLAASTAHELGTPLNTMALVLDDLPRQDPTTSADLDLLRQQVSHCREILRSLVRTAELQRHDQRITLPAPQLVRQAVGRWRLLRPGALHTLRIEADGNAPLVAVDDALQQAVVNLLNNGADADPAPLEIALSWDDDTVEIRIRDHGHGIDLALADRLGRAVITSKGGKGLGLGLFLSHATVERHGGTIRLENHPCGGTEAVLRLPNVTRPDVTPPVAAPSIATPSIAPRPNVAHRTPGTAP